MDWEIRKSTPADLDEVQRIARRTIDHCYRSFLGDAAVSWFINDGACDAYLKANFDRCHLLIAHDRIVGFCICKENMIDLLMVAVESHRLGHGARLLAWCEKTLLAEYDEIKLETYAGNERAVNFYRKHGWVETDRITDEETKSEKLVFTKRA